MIEEIPIARRLAWLAPGKDISGVSGLGYAYLSSALFAITWHEVKALPYGAPLAVDRYWRGYYVAERFREMTPRDRAVGLVHEANHLLRKHWKRQDSREDTPWFICGDLEINDDIQFEKFPALHPQQYGLKVGLSAEQYYNELPRDKIKTAVLHCGSCAGGGKQEYELPAPGEESKEGEKGLTEQEVDLVCRRVAHDIREQAKKRPGSVAGWAESWASTELEPKLNWAALLRRYMQNTMRPATGCIDYTYRRPSRRQWQPFVLPKMIGGTAKAVVVMDTSGSMDEGLLAKAIGELKGVARVLGADTEVLHVDTRVAKRQRIDQLQASGRVHGRGGTDMGRGIKAALEERPDVVVVVTDGETGWPREKPKKPVIICLVPEREGRLGLTHEYFPTPEWAQVVQVE